MGENQAPQAMEPIRVDHKETLRDSCDPPIKYKDSSTENICAIYEKLPGSRERGDTAEKEEADRERDRDTNFKEAPDFTRINTYEAYLDHYVTHKDLYYLESEDVARKITTLGFRVPELLTRDQFNEQMKLNEEELKGLFASHNAAAHVAYFIPQEEINCPLMQALAFRERQNRSGNLACIVYIRALNKMNQEISGWIDFKQRLAKEETELWRNYFTGKKRLLPRPSDLSYYNWTTFQVRYNSSDNYLVTTDVIGGLQFMNKLDRKLITLNPKVPPGDNTEVVNVQSPNYLDCFILDHFLRTSVLKT